MAQNPGQYASVAVKREYRSGGISWLGPRRVRLRVYVGGVRKTRVVTVTHPKDRGGRTDANEALAAFRVEMEAAREPRAARTLAETVEAYIAFRADQPKTARSTIESYRAIATRRISDDLKGLDVADVTAYHLDTFYGAMRKAGYAPTSVRQTDMLIRASLANAVRWGWIEENPATKVERPRGRAAKRPNLTPDDVWTMIRDASAEDPVLAMALFMLVITGARRGELCGLQWDDLDPERSCIHISRQLLPGRGGEYVAPLKSETGAEDGARTVYAGSPVLGAIDRYRDLQRHLNGQEPGGWFISYDGGQTSIRAKALAAAVSDRARRSGFTGVTTHSFRKVSANELLAAGVDPDAAARRLGHTTQVMLSTYVKGSNERAIAAASALEARLIDQGLPIEDLFRPPDTETPPNR